MQICMNGRRHIFARTGSIPKPSQKLVSTAQAARNEWARPLDLRVGAKLGKLAPRNRGRYELTSRCRSASQQSCTLDGLGPSVLPALFLLSGSVTAFLQSPQTFEGLSKLGYSAAILRPLAVLELVCPILYLVPRTAVLGAILLTAYLGGAVASHARIGDPMWVVPVVFGILIWCACCYAHPAFAHWCCLPPESNSARAIILP